jgi:hypothetical protein
VNPRWRAFEAGKGHHRVRNDREAIDQQDGQGPQTKPSAQPTGRGISSHGSIALRAHP